MAEPAFRLIMPKQMGVPATKLYAFGQEVPDVVRINAQTAGTGPDGEPETILTITIAGAQVVTGAEGTQPSAESR